MDEERQPKRYMVRNLLWAAETMQKQSDAGLNPFALTLIAESCDHVRDKLAEGGIVCVVQGKAGRYFLTIGVDVPEEEQQA